MGSGPGAAQRLCPGKELKVFDLSIGLVYLVEALGGFPISYPTKYANLETQ